MGTAGPAARARSLPVEEYKDMSDDDDDDDAALSDREDDDDEPLLHVNTPPPQRRRLILPEIPTFLYFTAMVIQYPVQQFWLVDHFSRQLSVNSTSTQYCSNASSSSSANTSSSEVENEVQTLTNQYVMYIAFVSNFTGILPTLFLGPLTDKFGRKFVFFVTCLSLLLSELLTLMVFQFDLSPMVLLVSSFVLGLSGSYGLYLAAAFGMVADISTAGKRRTFRVATLEASIAVGASLGLTVSGIWVEASGYVWPMAFALGLVFLALVFFVFIPETYVERRPQPLSCRTLLKCLTFFVRDTPNGRRFKLLLCLFTFLIFITNQNGETNFSTLYLLHQPFCWHKEYISIFNGSYTLVKWIVIMVMINMCKRWFSEPAFTLLGALSSATCYLMKGLTTSDAFILIGSGIGVFTDIVSPMCRTMMSKEVSGDEQGALFSGVGVLQLIVSAVGGVALSYVYSVGLQLFLGLPYLVLAGLSFLSALLIILLIIHLKRKPTPTTAVVVEEDRNINADPAGRSGMD